MDGTDIFSVIDKYIFTRCKLKYFYFPRLQKWNLLIFCYIGVTFIEKRVIFIDLLIYIRLGHVKFKVGMSIMKDITKVS